MSCPLATEPPVELWSGGEARACQLRVKGFVAGWEEEKELQLTETSPALPPSWPVREPPRSRGSEVAYIARRVA